MKEGGRVAERSESSNPMIASGNHTSSNSESPCGSGVGTGLPDGPQQNRLSMGRFCFVSTAVKNDFGALNPKIVLDRPGGRSLQSAEREGGRRGNQQ